ncbi:MAG: cryptochrome/photolyase family protein, partial [Gammaproteobacteria bacterium]
MKIGNSLMWFRRDLRAFDNAALHDALLASGAVHAVFIYDTTILDSLARNDRRVEFIHGCVAELDAELRALGGGLVVRHGNPVELIPRLAAELDVEAVFANDDYEPQAIRRDSAVAAQLDADGRRLILRKDHVLFDKHEVLTLAGTTFSVFTPYKNAWLRRLAAEPQSMAPYPIEPHATRLAPPRAGERLLTLAEIGFEPGDLRAQGIVPGATCGAAVFEDFLGRIAPYGEARNYPAVDGTSHLSVHLRFGTVSIRHLVRTMHELMARGGGGEGAAVWLSELIWRDFYQMILFHHPHVVERAFKPAYDTIEFETGPEADAAFAAWCEGRTGYPLVDAAMLQLNRTGYMHNRLRMVTASFLVKDLGIDWRRGERYFARQLIDYDLAANNGGWQWAASTGCHAQPWFRVFNPLTQSRRFDPEGKFIRRYLPQLAGL